MSVTFALIYLGSWVGIAKTVKLGYSALLFSHVGTQHFMYFEGILNLPLWVVLMFWFQHAQRGDIPVTNFPFVAQFEIPFSFTGLGVDTHLIYNLMYDFIPNTKP